MATTPYFVLSPNTILSIIGLIHGEDKTPSEPTEDWREATVDVVIPALNEENNILLSLASLTRQTKKPTRIILIDDGSSDNTIKNAEIFCKEAGVELIAIHRKEPIGKTPTLKRQSREFDSDVEFILDGDTVLESENYIERVVEELYKGRGVVSACGTILPLRDQDRSRMIDIPPLKKVLDEHDDINIYPKDMLFSHFQRGLTDMYREVLYFFLQKFVYRGQMKFFGSILNPVGCAVAYRRSDLKELIFDQYEPIMGDDLTNSEDIFIGFALNEMGFRNVQVDDVIARSEEPLAKGLPHQLYLWSSSFLQSCYYFDDLMRSPFKGWKRQQHRQEEKEAKAEENFEEKRANKEAYRQPFGHEAAIEFGRPIGWVLFMSAVEKIFFPTALLIMLILQMWEPLGITLAVEMLISLVILTVISKGRRIEFFFKGLLVSPLRYCVILFDLVTIGRFASDLWIFKNKRWRK